MIKIINIQSVSDVITNSSSEVFIKTNNETLKEILKVYGLDDYGVYLDSMDAIKKFVTEDYGADDLDMSDDFTGTNPYGDSCMIADLRCYKTDDEIWDFFKDCYKQLLGKLVINIDRDYLYDKEHAVGKFINWDKLD